MTALFQKQLDVALNWDMTDVLKRYQENTRLPDDVIREHELELKRFLALCAHSPKSYGMRGPIDELWHTFLMFTEDYHKFCSALGGGFIHHHPHVPTGPKDPKQFPKDASYDEFLRDYAVLLGVSPPKHIWPQGEISTDNVSCNHCGSACSHKCYA